MAKKRAKKATPKAEPKARTLRPKTVKKAADYLKGHDWASIPPVTLRPKRGFNMTAQAREVAKRDALELLADARCAGSLHLVAVHMGLTVRTLHFWRTDDADFRQATDVIRQALIDQAEARLYHDGVTGDSRALLAYLAANLPDKYAKRTKVEHAIGPEASSTTESIIDKIFGLITKDDATNGEDESEE